MALMTRLHELGMINRAKVLTMLERTRDLLTFRETGAANLATARAMLDEYLAQLAQLRVGWRFSDRPE
jgi:hypothetical protein